MFRLRCLRLRNGTPSSVSIQAVIEGHSDGGVVLGPPDRTRRRLILEDHLGGRLKAEALDVLADSARGFSGAEMELLCRRVRWAQRQGAVADIRSWLDRLVIGGAAPGRGAFRSFQVDFGVDLADQVNAFSVSGIHSF
jgi:hypothetical protein